MEKRHGRPWAAVSPEQIRGLRNACREGRADKETMRRACCGFEYLADWIILSVMERKTYWDIEYSRELGRIPCGRTDFYNYRRMFFAALSRILIEKGDRCSNTDFQPNRQRNS